MRRGYERLAVDLAPVVMAKLKQLCAHRGQLAGVGPLPPSRVVPALIEAEHTRAGLVLPEAPANGHEPPQLAPHAAPAPRGLPWDDARKATLRADLDRALGAGYLQKQIAEAAQLEHWRLSGFAQGRRLPDEHASKLETALAALLASTPTTTTETT